ncbi:hypothetical protein, partial [Acidianus sp. RZ1]|uniref:hypothetical protein n=1 Tax=Acidianus sp. RZ1 TaxID=1540082 RepID=UPI001491ADAD
ILLFAILALGIAITPTLALNSNGTQYIVYSISYNSVSNSTFYSSNTQMDVHVNISSTSVGDKYNNTITITGKYFTNSTMMAMAYTLNKTINFTVHYLSNESLITKMEKMNLTQILNFTIQKMNSFSAYGISYQYNLTYKPNGTETVMFNGKSYTVNSFKLYEQNQLTTNFGHSKNHGLALKSYGIVQGNALVFTNGILYSANINSNSNSTGFFGKIMSESSLNIKLLSTNLPLPNSNALDSIMNTMTSNKLILSEIVASIAGIIGFVFLVIRHII